MTSEIYVSGPALPPHGDAFEYVGVQTGMSRRDYFAAAALPAVIQVCNLDNKRSGETDEQMFARKALACADALIAASKEADHA